MGISPLDAKRMSMWEMAAVSERWVEAHDTDSAEEKGKLDEDEKDEIWNWMQAQPAAPLTLKEARAKQNGTGH